MALNSATIARVDLLIRKYGAVFARNKGWFEKQQAYLADILKSHQNAFFDPPKVLEMILRPLGADDFWIATEPKALLQERLSDRKAQLERIEAELNKASRDFDRSHAIFLEKVRKAFLPTFSAH